MVIFVNKHKTSSSLAKSKESKDHELEGKIIENFSFIFGRCPNPDNPIEDIFLKEFIAMIKNNMHPIDRYVQFPHVLKSAIT